VNYRVFYTVEVQGEIIIDAESADDAQAVVEGDSAFAELLDGADLSDQPHGEVRVGAVAPVE